MFSGRYRNIEADDADRFYAMIAQAKDPRRNITIETVKAVLAQYPAIRLA